MSGWIVETLIASTVLMLFVLAVRGPVAAAFGARAAYLLWLLPAARMVLPPLPDLATPSITALPVVIDLSGIGRSAHHATAVAAGVDSAIDWGLLLLLAWAAGAIAHFGWHLIQYRRLMRDVLAESTPLPNLDGPGVEVCSSPLARGPFAAGIFVKTVVLPQDYRTRYEAGELALAMRHEMTHHRRCDISANLAALGMLSLHWFNPLAYRAYRAFRIDQELACDAIVLDGSDAAGRQAYAAALVKSACDRIPAAACAIGAKDQLKRRLKMMGSEERTPGRARMGFLAVVAMVAGGLAFTASGGIAAEATRNVEKQVRVKIVQPDPASPVAAAAPVEPADPVDPVQAVEAAADARADAEAAAAEAAVAADEAAAIAADAGETRETEKLVRTVRVARRHAAEAAATATAAAAEAISKIDFNAITEEALRDAGCERAEVSASARDGKRQARVMACGGKGADAAEIRASLIEGLSEARTEMARESDLSADQRARIVAALDAKIAELRGRK